MLLEQVHRVRRGGCAPDRVDELLAAHRAVGVHGEYGQHHALLHRTQAEQRVVPPRLQPSQHLKTHSWCHLTAQHGLPPATPAPGQR